MPKITINDEITEAKAGENLLDLARRNAAHIWFVCDGRGLCRTCECRVISGSESMSLPTESELRTISDSRRREGYRLACQTKVIGPGASNIISVVEQLRRQTSALINRPEGTTWSGNAEELIGNLSQVTLQFASSMPYAAANAVPRIISAPPDFAGLRRYIRDTQRIFERLLK